jgi:hypothetical protein
MAIEIIKRGVVPDTIPIMVDCRHCSTRFSFLKTDAVLVPDQRDGDYYRIDCPVCHAEVTKAVRS